MVYRGLRYQVERYERKYYVEEVAWLKFRPSGLVKFAKSRHEAPRWLDKKPDIQGVVFLAGIQQYMRYVESLPKTYVCPCGATKEIGLFAKPSRIHKASKSTVHSTTNLVSTSLYIVIKPTPFYL